MTAIIAAAIAVLQQLLERADKGETITAAEIEGALAGLRSHIAAEDAKADAVLEAARPK